MARKKNPIIEAGARLDDEDQAFLDQEDSDANFDTESVDVETLTQAIQDLEPAERARIDQTRRRGQSPHKGHDVHAGRARQAAREETRTREVTWAPADTLYAPPPRAGMEQRWIRVAIGETDDPRNFHRKFREGWQPVKLSDVSEEYMPPSMNYGRFGTVVAVSDLVLCERPIEIGLARRKWFRDKLRRQLASADRRHVDRVQAEGHKIVGGARTDHKAIAQIRARHRGVVQDD